MTDEIDQSGIPTHECFNCGGNIFTIQAIFEDYEISMYWDRGTCVNCGSVLTVPTLPDHPFWDSDIKEIIPPNGVI